MWIRDGPLENLWGGGAGEVPKKKFAQGKIIWKKILARQLTLKIFMLWPKKNSYKEFDNEKKFLRLENSHPPPHNFSFRLLAVKQYIDATSTYFC